MLEMTIPIKRMLVANRGEIAVRVIRACTELGVESVALFSDPDRDALHVRKATFSVHIGLADPSDSYLNVEKIIGVAREYKCDAVHPGYGFLSENADFAKAVVDAGLVWIGPSPEAIISMGSKTGARAVMTAAGVPVVPGSTVPNNDPEALLRVANEVGFPVMLKASAGGGGKGMRLVALESELLGAFTAAKSEALKSFGDDTVYIEKAIINPKHVEVQVLGDSFGTVVHLYDRDCSVQRRHQKVIEEAPCPVLPESTRTKMCDVAVRAAKAVDYVGAGTIEFLLGADGEFYFLEMNTRLQVEHPISEMITGIDLCRAQIEVACGAPLSFSQEEISVNGHAMEFRIYAEDPSAGFLPAPGRILVYDEPGGPWVRVDSGVYAGAVVPIFYDPMVAKLIVWGRNRGECIERSRRALSEFKITGIKTPIGFYKHVLKDPKFISGEYNTSFITKEMLSSFATRSSVIEAVIIAAIEQYESDHKPVVNGSGSVQDSEWKRHGRLSAVGRNIR